MSRILRKPLIIIATLLVCTATSSFECKAGKLTVGAARFSYYAPQLKGKRVALFSNHTGMVGDKHTLDILLEGGIDVEYILSPEHGFRGTADAGEHVGAGVDEATGIRIVSLFGTASPKPPKEVMDSIDVIVCDIQDVGLRFYTYYVSMIFLMDACVDADKEFMVLDRPNPNGMYVDGPMLDMSRRSFVGWLPLPVVHGLTLGEMALMAQGEGWLEGGRRLKRLTVIPCKGYTHQTRYRLPIPPSPNLKEMKAVYLYPSTCFFEGTVMSLGRGTDKPFIIYGHPSMTGRSFSFVPQSIPGAKNPPHLGKTCYGESLDGIPDEEIISKGLDLSYVIDAYNALGIGDSFFTPGFERLMGRGEIRGMIEAGMNAEEIKASWKDELEEYKILRRKYLLYKE